MVLYVGIVAAAFVRMLAFQLDKLCVLLCVSSLVSLSAHIPAFSSFVSDLALYSPSTVSMLNEAFLRRDATLLGLVLCMLVLLVPFKLFIVLAA